MLWAISRAAAPNFAADREKHLQPHLDYLKSQKKILVLAGATILAIQRGAKYLTSLTPDDRIESADVLYLVGDESDILLARQRLSEGA